LKEKLYEILYMYMFSPASLGTDIWAFMIDYSQIELVQHHYIGAHMTIIIWHDKF
jgi:hypothetical protein